MNNYCTLFDSNYLTRGLAMYHSLVQMGENFHLYVIAFDELAYTLLHRMALPQMDVISLVEFENERLLTVKKTRTSGEYCWTCTSFSILYVLEHYHIDEVTYLDADLYFFASPDVLLDEFHHSGDDVMITKHRYTPEYDQTATSGVYCVQFMTFKNNANGLRVLHWWCDRCAEWCYARQEDGKFGDQKYLDDWTERFQGIYVMQNIGGGVAPWNVQQYKVAQGPSANGERVIFYHFHELKQFEANRFDLSQYRLSEEIVNYIYVPYIKVLQNILQNIRSDYMGGFSQGIMLPAVGFLNHLRSLKCFVWRKKKHCYNVVKL